MPKSQDRAVAMQKTVHTKLWAVVEVVRQGKSGDDAVLFLQERGCRMSSGAIARALRGLGGRGEVERQIAEGRTNEEIADSSPQSARSERGGRRELFDSAENDALKTGDERPLYPTTKMTLTLPSDLFEAITLAARGERKSKNKLVVDLLTSALSRMPDPIQQELGNAG
jgi:hypothetical protein